MHADIKGQIDKLWAEMKAEPELSLTELSRRHGLLVGSVQRTLSRCCPDYAAVMTPRKVVIQNKIAEYLCQEEVKRQIQEKKAGNDPRLHFKWQLKTEDFDYLIEAFLNHVPVREIARDMKISHQTIRKWLMGHFGLTRYKEVVRETVRQHIATRNHRAVIH